MQNEMITISAANVGLVLGVITIIGTIFTIFFYFQKPQIALERRVATLEDEQRSIAKDIEVVKATHLESNSLVQKEMKELTTAVNDLSKTVVRLSTIIDERIPKGSPSLTPAGI